MGKGAKNKERIGANEDYRKRSENRSGGNRKKLTLKSKIILMQEKAQK